MRVTAQGKGLARQKGDVIRAVLQAVEQPVDMLASKPFSARQITAFGDRENRFGTVGLAISTNTAGRADSGLAGSGPDHMPSQCLCDQEALFLSEMA